MIRIRQIKINIENNQEITLTKKISRILNLQTKNIEYNIVKKSLDARKKDNLVYVYEVDVKVDNEDKILSKTHSQNIFKAPIEKYQFNITGTKVLKTRPIIVGSGPAGLFCALLLAENGYKPLVIERGEKIEDRVKSVEKFWKTGKLNANSNVQFGEGGAGTFSDGKLNTLVKDKKSRGKKVFEIFVENGAPKEILYENKPHIGTDLLRNVIINIRNKIISMGGEIRYNTTLTNIITSNNRLEKIELNHKEVLSCNMLILAIGHSARDTFEMLYKNNLNMKAKPFAVGIRVEHSQEMINISQYGEKYYKLLPPASYKLTYQTKNKRGVYSFCMCPGGYVVNASSENNMLAINGMSNHKRDTKNANSALVVTISPKDFGDHPLDGIRFQRELEKKAFSLGKGKIPLQLYKDFKENKKTVKLGEIKPSTKGEYELTNLNDLFPEYINKSLKEGIDYFENKIKGFSNDNTILLGVESRTSSPVKIERDELGNSNIQGIYPCGEGAGYAGGITTSAIDGIKAAENISTIYKPN